MDGGLHSPSSLILCGWACEWFAVGGGRRTECGGSGVAAKQVLANTTVNTKQ